LIKSGRKIVVLFILVVIDLIMIVL